MKNLSAGVFLLIVVLMLVAGTAAGADVVMGDYEGSWKGNGTEGKLVAQVLALGDGQYQAHLLEEFDKRIKPIVVLKGSLKASRTLLSGNAEGGNFAKTEWYGVIADEKFNGSFAGARKGTFQLKRVVRKSPTMGAKPPAGAIVIFDGSSTDQWCRRNGQPCRWKLVDGTMQIFKGGIVSKRKFKDIKLHLEFRTPYMPKARGQGRGNSGIYVQQRYEVQVLASYALEGRDNECGGIYRVARPRVNMCYPPTQWQTYDITFKAPRFDKDGKKVKNAIITVIHNGVTIHENVEVPNPTGGNWGGDIKEPAGIHIQDHGSPVQYRNIWVVELKE